MHPFSKKFSHAGLPIDHSANDHFTKYDWFQFWCSFSFDDHELYSMSVNYVRCLCLLTTFDSFHCLQCLSITFDVCRLLSGWLRLIFNSYTQQYIWLNFDCVQLALSGYASKYDQAFSNWCVGSVWFQLNRLWSISKPSILKSLKSYQWISFC